MGSEENGDMEFQQTSGMNTNHQMSDKVGGANPFFGSGWDPLGSLGHGENFVGSSSMAPFSVLMENQGMSRSSHLVNFPSDSGLVEMVPKLPCFGSGSFSEMVGSFGLQGCGQMSDSGCPPNFAPNKEGGNGNTSKIGAHSQDDCQISDEASPNNGRKKKRALESHSPFNPHKNVEVEQPNDISGDSSEQDEKKQKIEENVNANLRGKQTGKQAKDNSKKGEDATENYIHVRARRGQATNSHSLAERVRRERISERMKLLQELVPGCNKITGKAVMLDEIINYVQSLQQQVEFLSMKLATVNPELNVDIERVLSKDILHSRGGNAAILGFGQGMSSSHPYPQGISQGTFPGNPGTNAPFHPLPQNLWDTELQSLLQMGFDSNPAINNLGPNGRSKFEL